MGIGKRLKEAREMRGLTQEELGRMVGVTGSAITNYEKEVSHPKESVMYALFTALDVEPNFLFQDCVDTIKKDLVNLRVGEAALDNELISRLCQLTPGEMEKVDAFVQGLLAAR